MLLKLGVDISRLHNSIRHRLIAIEGACEAITGKEMVITSTYEGTHMASSLHYQNKAIDIRLPKQSLLDNVILALRKLLGRDYDVVVSTHCIHIEYDPK